MSWRRCVFPDTVKGVTFPSHTWDIRPITTHWRAGQSEHTALLRTMSFVKISTIMYSMWKIMCFLNLKPRKRIVFHQIHKIMLFLVTLYDPFNTYQHKWMPYSAYFRSLNPTQYLNLTTSLLTINKQHIMSLLRQKNFRIKNPQWNLNTLNCWTELWVLHSGNRMNVQISTNI